LKDFFTAVIFKKLFKKCEKKNVIIFHDTVATTLLYVLVAQENVASVSAYLIHDLVLLFLSEKLVEVLNHYPKLQTLVINISQF